MNIVMLFMEDALKESIQSALEHKHYPFSATDDPVKLVRLVEQSRKPTIVLTERPDANPGAIHVLLAIQSTPALRQLTRIIGMDEYTAYHRLFDTGLIHDFVALPLEIGALLGSIEGCAEDLSASGVVSQDQAAPCDDGACDSLASYSCKICDVTLCLVHAFPQRDEPGWLCGACFVMPESRQEYWAGKFEDEWWRRWAPVFDDMEPYYTGDGPGSSWDVYELDGGEPDMDPREESSDEDDESEDLLDHLEEDLDGPAINTWALARAEVDRDYETDDWQAQELERDLYDDDDDYGDDYDDADDDYEAY